MDDYKVGQLVVDEYQTIDVSQVNLVLEVFLQTVLVRYKNSEGKIIECPLSKNNIVKILINQTFKYLYL